MIKFYRFFSILFLVGALSITSAFAQSTGFAPGKGYKQINFGIELQGYGIPVYAGMDFGVGEFITIGPRLILETQGETTSNTWGGVEIKTKSRNTVAIPSFRGDYHFSGHIKGLPEELDIYGGLTLGFVIVRSSVVTTWDGVVQDEISPKTNNTSPRLWGQLGARYFFAENWGVQLEFASYGTDGAIGMTYRF